MTKNQVLSYVIALSGYLNTLYAQNSFKLPENYPNAYIDYIYEDKDVKVVTETYAKNVPKLSFPTNVNNAKQNLLVDIYYGENSTVNLGLKPLIIFAPGGGRDKTDYKFLASDLARRGYVTASINVRGNTIQQLQLMFNSKNINPVQVMTAAMDLHLAINYILDQRAKALNIDPNYIIVGGGSFGGAISMQAAFMDKEEANTKFGNNVNNDFFKNYDDKLQINNIKGVLDFYGPMYDVNFIKPTESKPVFLFHGSLDPAAPYTEGNLFYNPLDVYMYGSVRIAEKLKENNNSFYFITGKDVGHAITPQCNYNVSSFPDGYPMNWYPDMLLFTKNAILGNQTIKVYKTVDCVEPECSMNKNSCRVVIDDVNNASRKSSNGNDNIPKPNFSKSIEITTPSKGKSSVVPSNNTTPKPNPVDIIQNNTEKFNHCKAFSFDGNDFVKLNNSPSISVGFEVEFWFKRSIANPDNNVEILYSIGKSNNIRNSSFTFGLLGNNQIYLGYNNGSTYIEKTQNITDNQNKTYTLDNNWHHIHFKAVNGNLSGEIDGNKGVFSLPNSIKTSVNTNNNSITYFGGADFNSGSISRKYNNAIGQIHEVRVWIPNNYTFNNSNDAVLPLAAGLVLYWKMNANGQTVKDDAPFKLDGTLGSNTSEEKSDPIFVNNCDGSTVIVPDVVKPTQNPNKPIDVLPTNKDTVVITKPTTTIPKTIIKEGINLTSIPSKTPIIDFNTQVSGKATIIILNSSNKIALTKLVKISTGINPLNTYFQALNNGNYTVKITFIKKTYTQKFTVTK